MMYNENTSAVGKSSFMMIGKPMMSMVPQSHKRRSGFKLSLLSGSVPSSKIFNPESDAQLNYENSDASSSCVASAVKSGYCAGPASSSGHDAPTNNSYTISKGNHGSGMNLYPSERVEEESSDSCDEEEEEVKNAQD